MASTLVIELEDADYDSIRQAAELNGKDMGAWLVHAAKLALFATPESDGLTGARDANGWPVGFFEKNNGSLADDPIVRLPQGDMEIRESVS